MAFRELQKGCAPSVLFLAAKGACCSSKVLLFEAHKGFQCVASSRWPGYSAAE